MNSEAAKSGRGKSGLIKAVMDKMIKNKLPISRRKAEKAVNAVFDLMKGALKCGEDVELPVGRINLFPTPAKRKGKRIQKFQNIHDETVAYRLVQVPDRMIRYRPHKELIERAPFSPPLPRPLPAATIRKAEELQELFCALTGEKRDIRPEELKMLLHAAEDNLDWLLARLRQMKKDGNRTNRVYKLVDTVRQMYWIRPLPEKSAQTGQEIAGEDHAISAAKEG